MTIGRKPLAVIPAKAGIHFPTTNTAGWVVVPQGIGLLLHAILSNRRSAQSGLGPRRTQRSSASRPSASSSPARVAACSGICTQCGRSLDTRRSTITDFTREFFFRTVRVRNEVAYSNYRRFEVNTDERPAPQPFF